MIDTCCFCLIVYLCVHLIVTVINLKVSFLFPRDALIMFIIVLFYTLEIDCTRLIQ